MEELGVKISKAIGSIIVIAMGFLSIALGHNINSIGLTIVGVLVFWGSLFTAVNIWVEQ